MYLDSTYIAKFYLNEPDSRQVRAVLAGASTLVSSTWAMGEVACAFHRHLREGVLDTAQYRKLLGAFLDHVAAGVWTLIPVTDQLMRKTVALMGAIQPTVYLRAGDAMHLTAAMDSGEREIWTSDRHLLAAAGYFGLTGRSA